MAHARESVAVGAEEHIIVHNLASLNVVLVKASLNWPAMVYEVVSLRTLNDITVRITEPAPADPSPFINWEVKLP